MNITIYDNYAEVNEAFEHLGLNLNNDDNAEDIAFIVEVRKWSWEGYEDLPRFPFEGPFEFAEHIRVGDKTDLFSYRLVR